MPYSEDGVPPSEQPPVPEAAVEKQKKTRALFINDNASWLRALTGAFRKNPDVVMAECHSVAEAMAAIEEHQPAIVFLDHQLTDGGDEGFEILEKIQGRGMTIYSTTIARSIGEEYERRGVKHLDAMDLKVLRAAVAGEPIPERESE